jgi:hypothetical protein
MTAERAGHGLKPLARFITFASAGVGRTSWVSAA